MDFDEIGAPTTAMVCGVCARVLDYHVDKGWAHPGWMVGDRAPDHVAVPVEPDQVQIEGQCDFCFQPGPKQQIEVGSFHTPAPGFGSAGNWACCDECARLIDTNQWNRLTSRAITSWEGRHGPMDPLMAEALRDLYRMVRKNMKGGVRSLQ